MLEDFKAPGPADLAEIDELVSLLGGDNELAAEPGDDALHLGERVRPTLLGGLEGLAGAPFAGGDAFARTADDGQDVAEILLELLRVHVDQHFQRKEERG